MAGPAADPRRLPAVLPLAIATALGVDLASARAYDARFGNLAFSTAAGLLLGGLAVLWLRVPRGVSLPASAARWLGVLPALAAMVSIHIRGILAPTGPLFALGALAVAGVAVMLVGTAMERTPLVVVGGIVAGIALRAFEVRVVPLTPAVGDMLPLVVLAAVNLAAGESPYRVYQMPWSLPLTYMPLSWLAYAPLVLARVDPRWTSALAELAILGALYFAARKRQDRTLRDVAVVLWTMWFVSNRIVRDDAQVAAQVQWAALTWLAALAVEKSRWTPAAFGAALATTPLALPFAPTLAVAWHRAWSRPTSRRPRRAAWWRVVFGTAIAAAVAAVLIAPWFLWSPREFVDGVFLWFNDLERFPRTKWLEDRAWVLNPGLTGLFWTLGLERLMKPLQAILVAGLAFRYARKTAAIGPRPALAAELVAVFLVFMLCNPIVWGYLWEPGVCLGLVALASARTTPP
jgi:hypothetical protein